MICGMEFVEQAVIVEVGNLVNHKNFPFLLNYALTVSCKTFRYFPVGNQNIRLRIMKKLNKNIPNLVADQKCCLDLEK